MINLVPAATTSKLGGVKRTEYPKVLTVPNAITPLEETTINITDTTAVSTVYNYSRNSSDDYQKLTINNNSSEIVSVGVSQSSSSFSSSKTVAPLIFGISCNRKEGSNNSVQDYEFTSGDIYLITPGESLKLNLSSSTRYNLVGIYKNGKLFI